MMVRCKEKRITVVVVTGIVCTLCICLLYPSTANAYALGDSSHAYVQRQYTATNTGGYFSSTNGQDDLVSNWTSSYNKSFITKEMWVTFSDAKQWIEIGDVDGSVNGNYWDGHYEALQRWNSSTNSYQYSQQTLGTSGPTGTHNFEVQYVGSNKWNVYIDFSNVDYWTFPYSTASYVNVGIESNETLNTFASGTYASAVEYRDTNGTWHYWPSGTNGDKNVSALGWYSSFFSNTDGTNKIGYYHN